MKSMVGRVKASNQRCPWIDEEPGGKAGSLSIGRKIRGWGKDVGSAKPAEGRGIAYRLSRIGPEKGRPKDRTMTRPFPA